MKNSLKILLMAAGLSLISLISSCKKDDESGPSHEFINQNLQGAIDGIPFTYGEGTVEMITRDGKEHLSFDLYHANEEINEVCSFFGFGNEVSAFFSIPAEVGLYELSLNFSYGGQTVTLFNPDGTVNNIASIGAVEILTVTETEVTGRMDATLDAENTVNGNFTAVFCPEN